MKKSYKDFDNKPLPDHAKIDYYECLAKIILEDLFVDEFKNLIIMDKPDLQCISESIGIEVTQAINYKQKENESLYVKFHVDWLKTKKIRLKRLIRHINLEKLLQMVKLLKSRKDIIMGF